ncbi:50S ribosomal protein L25 [Candidatus Parcubacteria bacterium]|jgi:large subunit ribosomal protein L25|nr:MAG: 50S ribosomal protein L25 [Candidatus Parcubacteria bacterium]
MGYNRYMKLSCTTRTIIGKKVKKLRAQGEIPAELFGKHIENRHLSINAKEFARVNRVVGTHGIIELEIDKEPAINVLITNIIESPYIKMPLSVGLQAVQMDEKIHTFVPVSYEGESPAEKMGFPILKLMDEVEIESLPKNVPESIAVDLSMLSHEHSKICIKDLSVPKGVKILHADMDQVVVTVGEKTKEEVEIKKEETIETTEEIKPTEE